MQDLTPELPDPGTSGINPISDTEALISGLGSSRGETVRLHKDKTEKHMLFSGLDMRKIN